jgi:hypothetical protein
MEIPNIRVSHEEELFITHLINGRLDSASLLFPRISSLNTGLIHQLAKKPISVWKTFFDNFQTLDSGRIVYWLNILLEYNIASVIPFIFLVPKHVPIKYNAGTYRILASVEDISTSYEKFYQTLTRNELVKLWITAWTHNNLKVIKYMISKHFLNRFTARERVKLLNTTLETILITTYHIDERITFLVSELGVNIDRELHKDVLQYHRKITRRHTM